MVIQTQRLLLQSPQEVKAGDVLAYYVSIADFRREFSPDREPSFYTEEYQQQMLRNQIEFWEADRGYRFYIRLGQEPSPIIGTIALNNVVRGAFQSCFLGYSLDEEHGNQGYMTEAVKRAVDFAFQDLGLHRVEGNVVPRNAPSRAVLEKCGFAMEGLSRKYLKINGVWEDHLHYVRLNEAME